MRSGELPPLDVVVDSPMAIEVDDLYRRHTELYDTTSLNLLRDGIIVVSKNGVIQPGTVV